MSDTTTEINYRFPNENSDENKKKLCQSFIDFYKIKYDQSNSTLHNKANCIIASRPCEDAIYAYNHNLDYANEKFISCVVKKSNEFQ